MALSTRSSRGLDLVNVFMADVKDGVGVYLSVYLLAVHHWSPSRIGIVVALPWLVSILAQSPVGALIDRTTKKRLLLVVASVIVAASCIVVVVLPRFVPIAVSQVALGLVQTIFPPCVAAISLGMVGHARIGRRIGRNESFNHGGNMLAAVVAIVIGRYVSYEGIFYFSMFQCVAIIAATLLIREADIDHDLARAAAEKAEPCGSSWRGIRTLFRDRRIVAFTAAIALWNVANGAMLPLLGQKLGRDDVAKSAMYLSICIVIAQTVMIAVAPLAARLVEAGRKRIFLIAFLLVPLRALVFAFVDDRTTLMALQLVDGVGAGIYGVLSILVMADLGKGTGHFNLLQGTTYAAVGLGMTTSSVLSGFVVAAYGYPAAFCVLAALGAAASTFFVVFVPETAGARTSRGTHAGPDDDVQEPGAPGELRGPVRLARG